MKQEWIKFGYRFKLRQKKKQKAEVKKPILKHMTCIIPFNEFKIYPSYKIMHEIK